MDRFLQEKDQYSSFLGGNQPLCVIRTEHTDAPRVLVIRDSYTDSLAPFLTQNFSEIHLFDPRMNLTSVKGYVEENQIDSVVVLYSIANFTAEGNQMFVLAGRPRRSTKCLPDTAPGSLAAQASGVFSFARFCGRSTRGLPR